MLAGMAGAQSAANYNGVTPEHFQGYRADAAEIPTDRALSDEDRARIALNAYAQCLVRYDRRQVEHALAASVASAPSQAAMRGVAYDGCLFEGMLAIPVPVFRGALFGALYRRDYGPTSGGIGPRPLDFSQDGADVGEADGRRYVGLHRFADCVMRGAPSDVRTALFATPASTTEATTLSGLSPAMSNCVVAGLKLSFTRTMLIGLLAEVAYREARSAAALEPARRPGAPH